MYNTRNGTVGREQSTGNSGSSKKERCSVESFLILIWARWLESAGECGDIRFMDGVTPPRQRHVAQSISSDQESDRYPGTALQDLYYRGPLPLGTYGFKPRC
jgi:hypothetical protein